MKPPSITKSISIKFETFKFSNADIFVSMTQELDVDDDVKEVGEKLRNIILEDVLDTKAIMDNLDAQVYDIPPTCPKRKE